MIFGLGQGHCPIEFSVGVSAEAQIRSMRPRGLVTPIYVLGIVGVLERIDVFGEHCHLMNIG
jgi:hypothetical protein